jgi:GntP family gluconate:H+ symporter
MVCAAAAGGAITHALVPPTPGPVVVSQTLGVPLGITFLMGAVLSLVPALVGGVGYAHFINRRLTIHPREVYGVSMEEMERLAHRPDSELPSLGASLAPVLIPVFLIATGSILPVFLDQAGSAVKWVEILGDKDVAFLVGALLSIFLVTTATGDSLRKVAESLEPAVVSGASIAFITCAGGAFGQVLTRSGVGDVIAAAAKDWGLSLLFLAFACAALIRVAQGSATVAMITTAGIIAPAVSAGNLSFHPVYLVAVIGFGATTTSWMNDSGFWIVCKMSGMSESETLKTWTVLLTVVAVAGFLWTWLLSVVFPLV